MNKKNQYFHDKYIDEFYETKFDNWIPYTIDIQVRMRST